MEVRLNCATDAVGRLAGPGGSPVRLSTTRDMARVHDLRRWADAILVGVETVIMDDPSLRVKPPQAVNPMPVVLDSHLRSPPTSRVFQGPSVVFHVDGEGPHGNATLVQVPAGPHGADLGAVVEWLKEHGIQRLMVEGGPRVLRAFVEANLWDHWTVFQSEVQLDDGPALWGGLPAQQPDGVHLDSKHAVAGGTLWTFSPE